MMNVSESQYLLVGGWEASRLSGIPYRTLDQWTRESILEVGEVRKGKRGYSLSELITARSLHGLRRFGLPMSAVKAVAGELRQREGWPRERLRVNYFLGNLIAIEAIPDGDTERPAHVSLPIDGRSASQEVLAAWVASQTRRNDE